MNTFKKAKKLVLFQVRCVRGCEEKFYDFVNEEYPKDVLLTLQRHRSSLESHYWRLGDGIRILSKWLDELKESVGGGDEKEKFIAEFEAKIAKIKAENQAIFEKADAKLQSEIENFPFLLAERVWKFIIEAYDYDPEVIAKRKQWYGYDPDDDAVFYSLHEAMKRD